MSVNLLHLKLAAFIFILAIGGNPVFSQCGTPAPLAAACSGTALTDGTSINTGNNYSYSGSSTTFSSINMWGGSLSICGILTINSFNYSGGNIVIEPGASLTINNAVSLNTATIANYGNLTINNSLTFNSSSSYLWNENSGTSTIGGLITINNGYLINNSIMTASSLNINTGGNLCMGTAAVLSISSLTNNQPNGITYNGSSPSCISISSSVTLNNNLTNSSGIGICLESGFTSPPSWMVSNWGSATLKQPCGSCFGYLPLNLIDFIGIEQNGTVILTWSQAGSFEQGETYHIQESNDGTSFHTIGAVSGNPNTNDYSYIDNNISASKQYYRIKQTDNTGAEFYSNVIAIKTTGSAQLIVYPNPAISTINISVESVTNEEMNLSLTDISGRILISKNSNVFIGKNNFSWDIHQFSAGTYILKLQSPSKGLLTKMVSVTKQ